MYFDLAESDNVVDVDVVDVDVVVDEVSTTLSIIDKLSVVVAAELAEGVVETAVTSGAFLNVPNNAEISNLQTKEFHKKSTTTNNNNKNKIVIEPNEETIEMQQWTMTTCKQTHWMTVMLYDTARDLHLCHNDHRRTRRFVVLRRITIQSRHVCILINIRCH